MSLDESSDRELWDSILNGDQAAFTVFFRKHWSQVYVTAFFYLKDKEVCKEITHDIFINIWLKREQLKILSFSAYLQAAGKYHVFKYLKRSRLHPVTYQEQLVALSGHACRNEGEEQLSYRELENNVDHYLKSLPRRCREVFILSRQEHLSNDQIAGKLGISKRTVENQITHALHHLRFLLKDVSLTIFGLLILLFR